MSLIPPSGAYTTWTGTGSPGTWSNGTAGQFGGNYANDLTNTVTFNGTGTTVTASGTPQAGSLFFDSTGYTLAGAAQLGIGTITTNGSISTTISANLSGNGSSGLTKAGVGSLLLSGSNSYTGTTALNAGTVTIGNANALGASGNITFSGGTLQYGSGNDTDFSSRIKNSGSSIIVDTNGNNVTFGTALDASNAGGLTKQGTGTLTLSVSNTLTGPLQVTGGTLSLSGGTLSINTASASTISGTLSGSGNLTKSGAGTLTITNNNSGYSGETRLEGGVLEIGNNGALGTGTVTFRAAGTIRSTDATDRTLALAIGTFTGGNNTIYTYGSVGTGNLTFSGTGSTALGSVTRNLTILNNSTTFGQSFTGTGAITKSGAGTLILLGDNTYTGATTITTGTLQIGNGGATGSLSTSSAITVNGTLTFNRSGDIVQGTNFSTAAITGTGSLIQNGSGNLTLNAANTYAGGTTLNSGTLVINNASALGSGTLTINGGAINSTTGSITLNNNAQSWNGDFAFTGTNDLNLGNGNVAMNATRMVTVNVGNLTVGGSISGSGFGLTKAGVGNLILSGANTYTGTTTINAGNLTLGANDRISDSSAVTISGGTLNLSTFNDTVGAFTISSGNLNGSGTLTGSSYALQGGTVNAILGAGAITVSSGTTTLGSAGRLNAASTLAINSGNLTLGGAETVGALSGSGGTLNVGSYTITVNQTSDQTFSGVTTGSGGLTKTGANTLTLGGANTYTGTTTINAGNLTLGADNRISDSSAVTISGGTLNLSTFNDTVGAFTITSGNLNGSGTLTGSSYALQGGTVNAILGAGAITVSSGTTTLGSAGRLNAASTLAINSGNLTLGGDETVAALSGSGGTLNVGGKRFTVNQTSDQTFSGSISGFGHNGNGGFVKTGNGTLTLAGSHAYTSNDNLWTFRINAGNVTLGANDRIASNSVSVHGGALNLSTFNNTVGVFSIYGGSLAGTGTLTAIIYYLNGGTVDANLGAGELYVSYNQGGTLLNGTTSATLITLSDDLTLGSANRLALGANVTILSGTLGLGGNETVDRFRIDYGALAGTGHTLTATNGYDLRGGTIGANLGAGTITVTTALNGPVTLSGTAASTTININSGNLTLGAADRLSDSATVTVSGGVLNSGSFADTVSVLNMSSGSIVGSGTLTATTYGLSGGTMAGALGAGTANITGVVSLTGTMSPTTLNVNTGGTLTLGSADRIGDSSSVTIGGGTLNLSTYNDTVGAFTISSGNLNGSGTLTGSSYALQGGTVNAILGAGAITVSSGTTTLGSAGRLNAASTLAINSGNLTLGGAETVGALSGSGGTLNVGSYTITVNQTSDQTFSGVITGSGGLTKNGAGTLTLNGTNSYNGSTIVNSGTLEAKSAGALGSNNTVQINGGTLLVTADDAINGKNITMSTNTIGLQFSGNYSGAIGSLTLSANSIIDMGPGSVQILFQGLSLSSHTLSFYNWTGSTLWNGGTGADTDKVFLFPTIDPGDLNKISFYSGNGGDSFLGTGFDLGLKATGFDPALGNQILPVPEPETWATAVILLVGGMVWFLKRVRHPLKKKAAPIPHGSLNETK